MLNISNLQTLKNPINLIIRIVEVFWVFVFYLGGRWEKGKGICVLILAGIELISFTVACMELCFGFLLRTVLITEGYFSYLHRGLLSPAHQQGSWRYIKIWEGVQLGYLTPSDNRDIPDHMASWFFAFQTLSNTPNTWFINNLLYKMLRMLYNLQSVPTVSDH